MSTIALDVTGMTCDHCVRAVTSELTALDGVTGVDVRLVAGGTTPVTVTTTTPVTEEALRAAVDEAGYAVVGVRAGVDPVPGDTHGHGHGHGHGQPAAPTGARLLSLTAKDATGGACGCGCGC